MIRFLQTPGPIKKIVLGGLLTVVCVLMAITLIPGFGSSSFMTDASTPGVVATVDGEQITSNEVGRQARQMLEQQYPKGGAQAEQALPIMATYAFQQLETQKLLYVEAKRMGLRATDDDVRNFLHQGQFGEMIFPNGAFIGEQAYEDFVSRGFDLTVPQFENEVKQQILIDKLRDLISASATVTEAEVRQQFEKQNTKVKFDYAVIKKDDILKTLHPTDSELKAYYDQNKRMYVNSIPEKRQVRYVVIDNAKLLAETQVTPQQLQDYYNQHQDEYRVPEQVNVRQIVINKPLPDQNGKVDQAAVNQAHSKADDILKQIKAGGDFGDLAKKYSQDSGTAKKGGSLGWVKPDVFPGPVAKVASSLAKGGTSDVIDAGFAFVILHMDDKHDAYVKTLDDVKAQIEPIIRQQEAGQTAQQDAQQILDAARNTTLGKAAAAKGLQLITTDFVDRNSLLPGIGSDPQFMTALFSETQNAPPDEAQIHQGYAIFQVTAIKPPSTPTFEEALARVEDEFRNERAAQLMTQKTQELSDRAKAEHDLKKAAKELGADYKTSDFVLPDGQVPDIGSMTGPAAVAFTLKPGEISGPIDAGNTGAVLTVLDRQAPSEQDYAAKKDQIRDNLMQQKQAEIFELFVGNLRDSMLKAGKIKVNEKELAILTKPRNEENE